MRREAGVLQVPSLPPEAILQRRRVAFYTVTHDYRWTRHQEELGSWQRERNRNCVRERDPEATKIITGQIPQVFLCVLSTHSPP